ncbi:MAG: hypothetical protein MI919_13970 [Holophagales bacterium]|nr:hypothetical protein [Holophagales bacterium]
MQLLVLGMHRSGTSMVTRLVNMMGASLGPEFRQQTPDEANPLGYWERLDLQDLHSNLLRACDGDWYHPDAVDLGKMGHLGEHLEQRARQLIAELDARRPWVVKDPRMCLVLPFWLPLLETPVAVFVYRHPIEVAESLHKRDGLPLAVGVALWQRSMLRCLRDLVGAPVVWVSQERLLTAPVETATRLHGHLRAAGVAGLELPPAGQLEELVDLRLYRARQRSGVELTPGQSALWAFFESEPETLSEGALPAPEDNPWVDHYCQLMLDAGDVPARLRQPSDGRQEWWEVTLREDLAHLGKEARATRQGQEALVEVLGERLEALESTLASRLPVRPVSAVPGPSPREVQLEAWVARYRRLAGDIFASRRWRLGHRLISALNLLRPGGGEPSALSEAARLEREIGQAHPAVRDSPQHAGRPPSSEGLTAPGSPPARPSDPAPEDPSEPRPEAAGG